jgi:phosphopantothenoylcysteine decarboxylase/phosphopantothenate--cysteine ligase
VRFISNRSSGKMGYALAAAARDAGARVILVSGPVLIPAPVNVDVVDVESAKDMHAAVHDRVGDVDIFIGVAAVSDYHVTETKAQKIKKSGDGLSLDLEQSPDILASVAALPDPPFTVGFAAETEKLRTHALAKLERKQLDMIVANLVGRDKVFQSDHNAVEVYWQDGEASFPERRKEDLARDLVSVIIERYEDRASPDSKPETPVIAIRD